jgi:hypothetical protein
MLMLPLGVALLTTPKEGQVGDRLACQPVRA